MSTKGCYDRRGTWWPLEEERVRERDRMINMQAIYLSKLHVQMALSRGAFYGSPTASVPGSPCAVQRAPPVQCSSPAKGMCSTPLLAQRQSSFFGTTPPPYPLNFGLHSPAPTNIYYGPPQEAGVGMVVAEGKFGDMYLHFLNKYTIMAVRLNSKFDVRRLCQSVGATPQTRISVPNEEHTGMVDSVYLDEVGDTEDGRLVPGAGAVEIELARQIESFGEKCEGVEQYAIQKFTLALEALPKQLADNSGWKATEVLLKLYAEHQNGNKKAGFDNEIGWNFWEGRQYWHQGGMNKRTSFNFPCFWFISSIS